MNDSFLELKNTNICVEFSVLGNDFDSNIITKRLNINPDSTHIKGEPIKGRNNLNYKEVRKRLCKPPLSSNIKTMEVLLCQ